MTIYLKIKILMKTAMIWVMANPKTLAMVSPLIWVMVFLKTLVMVIMEMKKITIEKIGRTNKKLSFASDKLRATAKTSQNQCLSTKIRYLNRSIVNRV